jgi:hypothetical protein
MPTVSTVPLLLLGLVLWKITKGELLSVVLFMSIFQAASAINLGGMGIAPWIVVLLAGLILKTAKRPGALTTISNTNTLAIRLLTVFVCYALFTGIAYPLLFQGVLAQGSHDSYPSPLSLGMANIAQICYLLSAVVVFGMALMSSREAISSALDWYVRGCILACFIAMYQLANATIHIPYPNDLFYSNPRYVIYPAYMIDGMWRLNSTFTEASSLAGHLCVGVALLGWNVMTRPLRWGSSLSLILMIVTMMMTLSSTGYLSTILLMLVAVALSIRALFRAKSLSRVRSILLVCTCLVVTVLLLTTKAATTVDKTIHTVIIDKKDSASYRDRTATNYAAMETARQTYYMGAGWGSVRCSSLGPGLLATVGLVGVLLFSAFLISLAMPLFSPGYKSELKDFYPKSLLGTFVILAAMMISGNEPDQPVLWLLFAAAAAGPTTYKAVKRVTKGYGASPGFQRPARSV